MYGFPLTFGKIYKRMHKGKRKFSSRKEFETFNVAHPNPVKSVYLCPFCSQFHVSSHGYVERYSQEFWWVIWQKLVEQHQLEKEMF